MNLEGIKLSEVNWAGKDMHYDFTYMGNLKNREKNKHNKTETVIDTENNQVVARGQEGKEGKK